MALARCLSSSLLSVSGNACQYQTTRGLLFSSKKGISRDTLAWLTQPLDLSLKGLLSRLKKATENALIKDHSFLEDRHGTLGPDLATAHFVVARDGAIKFDGFNRWIKKSPIDGKYSLPSTPYAGLKLEAVDVSDTKMMYLSFDNFVNLRHLKYLSVAGCPGVDDWVLDRFVMFRDSLLVLDISRCSNVTERGLASLHKLHKLKRLRLSDMPCVEHRQLTALLLEEVLPPGCIIEGIDFAETETAQDSLPIDRAVPAFLQHYEQFVATAANAKVKAYESARQELVGSVKQGKE